MPILDIAKTVLAWIMLVIILPIPLLLLYSYKLIVTLIAVRFSNLIPFEVSDAAAINDNPYQQPLLNIGFVLQIDGYLTLTELRELAQAKLFSPGPFDSSQLAVTRPWNLNLFCYIQKFGGYYFKRVVKSIDIEEQVSEILLKRKHIAQSDHEMLCEFLSDCISEPYEHGKPLWNMKLVKIEPNQGEKSWIVFRSHHSMLDGLSLINVVELLTGDQAISSTKAKAKIVKKSFVKNMGFLLSSPLTFLRYTLSITSNPNPLIPVSSFNTRVNFNFITLDLAKIKYIRKEAGDVPTHVLPIMLTLLGSVLRSLLLQKGKYAAEEDLPDHFYVNCPLSAGVSRKRLGNTWTIGAIKVPLKSSDVLRRLSTTENDYVALLDKGIDQIVMKMVFPIISLFPAWVGQKLYSDFEQPISTTWSALIVGNDYKLLGRQVEHRFPFVGCTFPRMTWSNISVSYSNKMEVSMAVNPSFINDYTELHSVANGMFNEELENLVQAVRTRVSKRSFNESVFDI